MNRNSIMLNLKHTIETYINTQLVNVNQPNLNKHWFQVASRNIKAQISFCERRRREHIFLKKKIKSPILEKKVLKSARAKTRLSKDSVPHLAQHQSTLLTMKLSNTFIKPSYTVIIGVQPAGHIPILHTNQRLKAFDPP